MYSLILQLLQPVSPSLYDEDTLYSVTLDPDHFFMTDVDLDFSIVACDPTPLPDDVKAIPRLRDPDTITRGERVNIIQHPRGRRKEISLHDNKVNYVYDVGIRYTADTEGGSSARLYLTINGT
jgi:hypothetical protein